MTKWGSEGTGERAMVLTYIAGCGNNLEHTYEACVCVCV